MEMFEAESNRLGNSRWKKSKLSVSVVAETTP